MKPNFKYILLIAIHSAFLTNAFSQLTPTDTVQTSLREHYDMFTKPMISSQKAVNLLYKYSKNQDFLNGTSGPLKFKKDLLSSVTKEMGFDTSTLKATKKVAEDNDDEIFEFILTYSATNSIVSVQSDSSFFLLEQYELK